MNQKTLFALWGGLFIVCAGLGFIPEPAIAGRVVLTMLSLLFFLPPLLLIKAGGDETLKLVRNLSALSLGLTLVILILNFLCAFSSELLGNVMHFILVIVSAPMIASGYWVLSLFLWACLLMAAVGKLRAAGDKAAS